MRVTVSDARLVGSNRDLLRFAVSFCDDEGVPHFTVKGWLFDREGHVKPPTVYTGRMRRPSDIHFASDKLTQHLEEAISTAPKLKALVDVVLERGAAMALEREAKAAEGIDLGEVEL